jgi:hypothetical protein
MLKENKERMNGEGIYTEGAGLKLAGQGKVKAPRKGRFVKGSDEAKEHMAKLRCFRKAKAK